MVVSAVTVMMVVDLLLLGLIGLLATLIDDSDVVVEDGGDDGNHVSLDDSGADVLGASDADVDDTLESEVPFPHAHHVLATALFEDAYEALDASIDGEDVSDARRGGGEVGEMVEGVDERKGRGTVEGATVVKGRGDTDGRLVDVGDAEVDLPHDGQMDPAQGASGWARSLKLVMVIRPAGRRRYGPPVARGLTASDALRERTCARLRQRRRMRVLMQVGSRQRGRGWRTKLKVKATVKVKGSNQTLTRRRWEMRSSGCGASVCWAGMEAWKRAAERLCTAVLASGAGQTKQTRRPKGCLMKMMEMQKSRVGRSSSQEEEEEGGKKDEEPWLVTRWRMGALRPMVSGGGDCPEGAQAVAVFQAGNCWQR